MRSIKQILSVLGIAVFAAITACNTTVDVNLTQKKNLSLDPYQVAPVLPTYPGPFTNTGTGYVDATYNRDTRLLSYKIVWSALPANPTATSTSFTRGFGIYGPAPEGYSGPLLQSITGFTAATAGTFSGTLFIDNVILKQEDLLAGKYYISIPCLPSYPVGAVRAQIKFN